jgi:hypothetical protein
LCEAKFGPETALRNATNRSILAGEGPYSKGEGLNPKSSPFFFPGNYQGRALFMMSALIFMICVEYESLR